MITNLRIAFVESLVEVRAGQSGLGGGGCGPGAALTITGLGAAVSAAAASRPVTSTCTCTVTIASTRPLYSLYIQPRDSLLMSGSGSGAQPPPHQPFKVSCVCSNIIHVFSGH